MVSIGTVRELALAFPQATEEPHFEKPSFRVKKKIFATLHVAAARVVVKLNSEEQSVFCAFDPAIIYPLPGAWGRQGWTMVELKKIRKAMFRDMLTVAYCRVAPVSLAAPFLQK